MDKTFLGAWDLCDPKTGQPRDYTLEIESVKGEVVKSKEVPKGKRKIVIRFKGASKAFICNSTNAESIESMHGADYTAWPRQRVTLYQGETRDPKTGKQVKCIRVRTKRPQGPAEEIVSQPVDETMRDEQEQAFGREPGDD
jgi:hypothetical protein